MEMRCFSLFADEFALGEKFAQIVADSAFDDLPKALMIFFDLEDHKINFAPSCGLSPAAMKRPTIIRPAIPRLSKSQRLSAVHGNPINKIHANANQRHMPISVPISA